MQPENVYQQREKEAAQRHYDCINAYYRVPTKDEEIENLKTAVDLLKRIVDTKQDEIDAINLKIGLINGLMIAAPLWALFALVVFA